MTDLPRGWEPLQDPQGRTYYHDTSTGNVSWTPPPPPPPPPPEQAPTAPPLSSSNSYSSNAYPQQTSSYHPGVSSPPPTYTPSSAPPHSASGPSHLPTSGPDYGPPRPQQHPSLSQHYDATHGYPAHHPSYPVGSQPYVSNSHSYSSQPSHASLNGGGPSHLGRFGQAGSPYGYPPPPRPGYHPSPHGGYPQQPPDPQIPPPLQPPYHSQGPHGPQHGGYGPPPASPYAHVGQALPQPGDYGRPPNHPLPPPGPQPSPSAQPPQSPPQGYPSAPNLAGQQSLPHQQQQQQQQQPSPPHQPSYQALPGQHPSYITPAQSNMSGITSDMSQLSIGMGPGSKVIPISLEFRAVGLRDRDFIGKSDPLLYVLEPKNSVSSGEKASQWKTKGQTEIIRNNVNPTWANRVNVKYYFECHQPLRFEVIDVDNFKTMQGDHLGFVETTLAEIVQNGVVRLKLRRRTGSAGRGEITVLAHNNNPAGKVKLQLSLAGRNLAKKDFMGKSDPYYKLSRVMSGSGGTSTLYISEEKKNDSNPTWKPHTLMIPVDGKPWTKISFVVEVFDWDRFGQHDLIGETTFALSELTTSKSFPLIDKKKQAKKGSRYKNSGELVIHRADATELPGFISYLQGGLRLDFIVAVDFTASNRPVDNRLSLHYMDDPSRPSQYYQALQAIGTVLSGYLVDGYITALGFGAKLPGRGDQACFDFALTGQPDARVFGVQGLLNAYKTALTYVTLAGPTNFTPIIRQSMKVANSVPVSQTNQHFAVLLILTDGIITDLSATIDAIIDVSHSTPMAIVIVGVGNTDFQAMERLDGDNVKLRSDHGDKVAKHDIVQFTKFDPKKPIEYLSSEVLQEVPLRVVEYMADAGIKPNPPPAQSPPY